MRSAEAKKQRERRTHNTDKLLWLLCILLLMLSATSLWNAYRLHQTAKELLAPPADTAETGTTYVLNTSSKKIHSPTCRYAATMQETNKQVVADKTLDDLLREGYSKCSVCNAE